MSNQPGEFIWYELLTSDAAAAEAFYGAVIGWKARSFDGTGEGYRLFSADDADVAGFMTITEDAACNGARPGWLGYIGADDVDATASKVLADGGQQHMPPTDIPGVGRFALLADRQGAPFYVMRGAMEGESTAFASDKLGHCCWNELTTSDPADAFDFYLDRFGWQRAGAMPMGEMGDYAFFVKGDLQLGAISPAQNPSLPSAWLYYFAVADIDLAHEAIKAASGQILYGPAEVPGGVYIVIGADPQGAAFGVVGPKKG